MMIFVTPRDTDNRFVIYLKTSVCRILQDKEGIHFESAPSKIEVLKEFMLNYGVGKVEVRETGKTNQLLIHDDDVYMQLDDSNNLSGLKVPILTIL